MKRKTNPIVSAIAFAFNIAVLTLAVLLAPASAEPAVSSALSQHYIADAHPTIDAAVLQLTSLPGEQRATAAIAHLPRLTMPYVVVRRAYEHEIGPGTGPRAVGVSAYATRWIGGLIATVADESTLWGSDTALVSVEGRQLVVTAARVPEPARPASSPERQPAALP